MEENYYLKIGSASDLNGRDKIIYRAFEILPAFLSWSTLLSVILFSWIAPAFIAIFIIIFDIYWIIKSFFLSFHLSADWKKMKRNLKTDWEEKLNTLYAVNPEKNWNELSQIIILPLYKESFEIVSGCIEALLYAKWPNEKMFVVLSYEERAGDDSAKTAEAIKEKYGGAFANFLITRHPKNLPGEKPGKGSNICWAGELAKKEIVEKFKLSQEKILVSAFDIDTIIESQYFLILAYNFLTAKDPLRSSFQPVPVYNNNIWQAPFFSRVAAVSGTFWQMMQQERPERLATFSSHSMTFKALNDVGFWQKNMVSEDSRIFWNCFLYYNGDYKVVPLSYSVSMDANLGKTFWQTAKNVYKQQRRWTWGVENLPYILFGFLKNKKIPFKKKLRYGFIQIEGFWSLATNPLMIFLLGWLPLLLGGQEFNATLLSYNLPRMTRDLMNIALLGLVGSAIISTSLLPKIPEGIKKRKYVSMVLQWIFIPFTIIFFGAIPGLEAQTRLALGGKFRLGFWVTPKERTVKPSERVA